MTAVHATPARIEARTARFGGPGSRTSSTTKSCRRTRAAVVDTNDIAIPTRYRARRAAFASDAVTDLEAAGQRFDWEVEG